MKRYNNIEILKNDNGKRFLKSIKYPIIKPHIDDIYIIGGIDDRLDNLANTYYNDSTKWWVIARANGIGLGDLNVPIGMQLVIPSQIDDIVTEYEGLNNG